MMHLNTFHVVHKKIKVFVLKAAFSVGYNSPFKHQTEEYSMNKPHQNSARRYAPLELNV